MSSSARKRKTRVPSSIRSPLCSAVRSTNSPLTANAVGAAKVDDFAPPAAAHNLRMLSRNRIVSDLDVAMLAAAQRGGTGTKFQGTAVEIERMDLHQGPLGLVHRSLSIRETSDGRLGAVLRHANLPFNRMQARTCPGTYFARTGPGLRKMQHGQPGVSPHAGLSSAAPYEKPSTQVESARICRF